MQRGRALGVATLTAAALVLVLAGADAGRRGDPVPDAGPPTITVDGARVRPASYAWYSADTGTIRRSPVPARPRTRADFPAARPRAGAVEILTGGVGRDARVDVTFFDHVDGDGQPVRAVATRRCAGDPGCRWSRGPGGRRVDVPVAAGARFVAITVSEDVPGFASALPVTSVARYGVVLETGR